MTNKNYARAVGGVLASALLVIPVAATAGAANAAESTDISNVAAQSLSDAGKQTYDITGGTVTWSGVTYKVSGSFDRNAQGLLTGAIVMTDADGRAIAWTLFSDALWEPSSYDPATGSLTLNMSWNTEGRQPLAVGTLTSSPTDPTSFTGSIEWGTNHYPRIGTLDFTDMTITPLEG